MTTFEIAKLLNIRCELVEDACRTFSEKFPHVNINNLKYEKFLSSFHSVSRRVYSYDNVKYLFSFESPSWKGVDPYFDWSIYSEEDEAARKRMRIQRAYEDQKRNVLKLENKLAQEKEYLRIYAEKHSLDFS